MKRLFIIFVLVLGSWMLPAPAPACSFCPGTLKDQPTLLQEYQQAKMVLYGYMANARLAASGDAFGGMGTTDFHIEKVLKAEPSLGNAKVLQLPRYVPILDAKRPPRFLVFFDIVNGKLDPYLGKPVQSAAVIDYLDGACAFAGKSRAQALQYHFRFLDHPDETVSSDAFLEFAKSQDRDVAEASRLVSPEKLRVLLQRPRDKSYYRGVFAFMLGNCGGPRDAEFLRTMLNNPGEETLSALDGILAGYIILRPREGWSLAYATLADAKKPFTQRHLTFTALRFLYGWKPEEYRSNVVRGLGLLVADGDVADLGIEELRRMKAWDHTDLIVAQYGKPSHDAPIIRRCILRYALCAPRPEAKRLVDQVRMRDPDLVRELEEGLQLERPKG